MANTLASNISAAFIIKGTPIYEYGQLASTYSVGYWVYESATGTWTAIDADTAGTIIMNYGCVGYKENSIHWCQKFDRYSIRNYRYGGSDPCGI